MACIAVFVASFLHQLKFFFLFFIRTLNASKVLLK